MLVIQGFEKFSTVQKFVNRLILTALKSVSLTVTENLIPVWTVPLILYVTQPKNWIFMEPTLKEIRSSDLILDRSNPFNEILIIF